MQNCHDGTGGAGVKSSGRFIQEQNTWRRDEFHANVDALAFTARHSANKCSPNLSIIENIETIERIRDLKYQRTKPNVYCINNARQLLQ